MKKQLGLALALILFLSIASSAAAAAGNNTFNASQGYRLAEDNGLSVTQKITDAKAMNKLIDDGLIALSDKGEPPHFVLYLSSSEKQRKAPAPSSSVPEMTITKTSLYTGQYFDDYSRYVIDGPSTIKNPYTESGIANWNTSMSADVTIDGTTFTVEAVKAAVSHAMGHTIGERYENRAEYEFAIPDGRYCEVKIWSRYQVFTWTAAAGSTTIATGQGWYPNGLILQHAQYDK